MLSKEQLDVVQRVMGPVGCALACLMFLSSIDVLRRIVKNKSVGEFSYFPFLVQVCNCALWVAYAWVDYQDGKMLWPLLCNAFGLVMASISMLTFFAYCDSDQRKGMVWCLLPIACVVAIDAWVQQDTSGLGVEAIGYACLVINMVMYYGPCAGIGNALRTKSTEYMPLSLGVSTLLCSAPWFLFGVAIETLNIWLPNACGLVFGSAQVIVYMYLHTLDKHEGHRGKKLFRAAVHLVVAVDRLEEAIHEEEQPHPRAVRQRLATVNNLFDLLNVLRPDEDEDKASMMTTAQKMRGTKSAPGFLTENLIGS